MTESPQNKPLPAQMLDLIVGYWVSKMVYVAAKLGVADKLRAGGRSPSELAGELNVDPDRLKRLLRALASVGVFAEDDEGRFALTPLAETLCSDQPGSMRDFALMIAESYNWDAWDGLAGGMQAGSVPFEDVFGEKSFEYLGKHPEHEAVFARSMASISGAENPAIAAAIDLSGVETLVELGGSGGHLLASVLSAHEGVRGVLFDLPQVIERSKQGPFLAQPGIAERVSYVGGDFFKSVPTGADAFMMKYILHDWNDDECVAILSQCKEALATGGRVFVVDAVIEPGNGPQWGKLLDINMLVVTGGRERTEAEFAQLFERAGLRFERTIQTECPLGIVVGVVP